MLSYNDRASESSESDLQDDHIYKATTNYGKIAQQPPRRQGYSSSEEEDDSEDSLSDEPEEELPQEKITRKPIDKVAPIYQRGSDSQQDSSQEENSIDHIEQRIKRLEMDLEKKIDKHKKESGAVSRQRPQTATQKGKNLKSAASPPLPKKLEAKSGIISKGGNLGKPQRLPGDEVELQGKADVEEYLPPTKKEPKAIEQLIEEQREAKEPSPKKKLSKQKREDQGKNPSIVVDKKRTQSKNASKVEQPHQNQLHPSSQQAAQNTEASMAKKLAKANKQIEDLSKALEESKKENKRLREQLSNSKKKKGLQQVQKLKELTADSQDVKLEKEIQLLKIIEGLQAKLKKSINKKLGKSRAGSTSAALLHKGLPSSLMH